MGLCSDKLLINLPILSSVCPDLDNVLRMFYDSAYEYFIFSRDLLCVHHILKCHGIAFNSFNMEDCQNVIARHILQGHCVEKLRNADHRPCACLALAQDVYSAEALSMELIERLCEPMVLEKFELDCLRRMCSGLGLQCDASHPRRKVIQLLLLRKEQDHHKPEGTVRDFFIQFDTRPRLSLVTLANAHGIQVEKSHTLEDVRIFITRHICRGDCASEGGGHDCAFVLDEFSEQDRVKSNLQSKILSMVVMNAEKRSLRRILQVNAIDYDTHDGKQALLKKINTYIQNLSKCKHSFDRQKRREQMQKERDEAYKNEHDLLISSWPQMVLSSVKKKLIENFRQRTSVEQLTKTVCASCGESLFITDSEDVFAHTVNLDLLRRPDRPAGLDNTHVDDHAAFNNAFEWLDPSCTSPHLPKSENPLGYALLNPLGVHTNHLNELILTLCKTCFTALKKNMTPSISLANRTFLGCIPNELKELTPVEESMIARCRAKCWVVQLNETEETLSLPFTQRGMRGHIIIYPQHPQHIATVLPPSVEDIVTPVCVLFVGSKPPSQEWLQKKAKPLSVRREKVREALLWLKAHNHLYNDIVIDHNMLDSLHHDQILPFHVEHVLNNEASDSLTSHYDPSINLAQGHHHERNNDIPFDNVVITDIDAHAPAHELRAAAVRHVKKKGGAYLQIPHDPEPVNEFNNPHLLPMCYPTLFPYGIGGFEDERRTVTLSFKAQAKHFFLLHDTRFQEHFSFLFTIFNMLQRRSLLLHTSLKVKRASFPIIANHFATVSPEAVHCVSERVSRGDSRTCNNEDERKVLRLMKEVQVVTSHVPGSSASRIVMRNEIRGLMMDLGLPSFYLTINPADVFHPLVKFLAGSNIDIDHLLPEQVPNYYEQSILVARNPVIAAQFFNIYIKTFISSILAYDPNHKNLEGGILGVVNGYYGCVEAQGRGSLHCHMLIWVDGSLNPNEICEKATADPDFASNLLRFLDDTISNSVPEDPLPDFTLPIFEVHPCTVRGVHFTDTYHEDLDTLRQKDLHKLVEQCQRHKHSKTCYKYWKGFPEPKECRFDLDEKNICAESSFDVESGEICLRCLDGLVNNFNATMLEAIRCNMDIKFIGSGPAAKAILYYITDYITKSQLKTHVAYAALELAVKKLGEYDPDEDVLVMRAKHLLQKCAHAMISHQELSGQQVSSSILDLEDHFTSHEFQTIYWTSLESFIEKQMPSPACHQLEQNTKDESSENSAEDTEEIENTIDETTDMSQQVNINDENEEEIRITCNKNGEIVPQGNQLCDYLYRGHSLTDICAWDFFSQVQKVRKTSFTKNKREGKQPAQDSIHEECLDTSEHTIMDIDINETNQDIEVDQPLQSTSWKRPISSLLPGHDEHNSHVLKIQRPSRRVVPVPVGPSIPRRDNKENYARYCRLMLIFFKPWRDATDLKSKDQSWEDAYKDFLHNCPLHFKKIMDNMQILHECKDCRDDHFVHHYARRTSLRVSQEITSSAHYNETDDLTVDAEDDDILTHLESIDNCNSIRTQKNILNVLTCLQHAERNGMFQPQQSIHFKPKHKGDSFEEEVSASCNDLESIWKDAYEKRRDMWKKKVVELQPDHLQAEQDNPINMNDYNIIQDAHLFNIDTEIQHMEPQFGRNIPLSSPAQCIEISQLIIDWNLNTEQTRAFKIIAEHSLQEKPDPLRMFIGGCAGTGKSRVIKALKAFFLSQNQARRFRLASYMGVAAKNVSGMTLHAALNLGCRNKSKKNQLKGARDRIAMWDGVDYLFIDEVSMIGCRFLCQISEALIEAKGNTNAFGNINIIFAGDFAQLGPVGDSRLFSHLDTNNVARSNSTQGQKIMFGKLLWLSITTVVILTEIMRQSGPENIPFIQCLGRLRTGNCTESDYDLLNSRVLENADIDIHSSEWKTAPIIVSDNATKDALNTKLAAKFASETGQQLEWYYSTDKRSGKILTDPQLKEILQQLHSGQTGYRLGKIPLVKGMPVLINQNFDVEGGIVNGSTGTIDSIRYTVDGDGDRHLVSCTVLIQDCTDDALPHLQPHHIPILEDTVDMTFIHPFSKRKCTIHRTQVPILPAFAMTVHKAQGQSLTNVIVDLESCSGTESPYVMVSRATSLTGLLILRPFQKHKIRCRQSQDSRNESTRLQSQALQTKNSHGTDNEGEQARSSHPNKEGTFPTASSQRVNSQYSANSPSRETHASTSKESGIKKRGVSNISPDITNENLRRKRSRF